MLKRPVIGITVDTSDKPNQYESPCAYSTAVEKAGGLPLLLPYCTNLNLIPQFVDLIDGMLFSGGNDLDPALYNQPLHPGAEPIDPDRQHFEWALLAEIERRNIPTLGVCLGSQLMNVYRGGSLIQFLPDGQRDAKLEHRKRGDPPNRHEVIVDTRSRLGQAIGVGQLSVNTSHKQAVDRLGKGLRIIARASDGVIEGFEDPDAALFAAVQWHPERLHEEPEHLAPFKLLVETALRKGKD